MFVSQVLWGFITNLKIDTTNHITQCQIFTLMELTFFKATSKFHCYDPLTPYKPKSDFRATYYMFVFLGPVATIMFVYKCIKK